MNNNCFIEFTVTNTHTTTDYCISKVMTMLHGIMRKTETNIGVSFPEMESYHLGNKIRLFGSSEQLMLILSDQQIKDACRRSLCSLSVYFPTPVPSNGKLVSYQADRNQSHNIMSSFNSKLTRYEKRHNEKMPLDDQRKLKLNLVKKSKKLPFFMINSTNKTYSLYITKTSKEQNENTFVFNSHGLGNLGGCVYDF